jgi:hypothetical protein
MNKEMIRNLFTLCDISVNEKQLDALAKTDAVKEIVKDAVKLVIAVASDEDLKFVEKAVREELDNRRLDIDSKTDDDDDDDLVDSRPFQK